MGDTRSILFTAAIIGTAARSIGAQDLLVFLGPCEGLNHEYGDVDIEQRAVRGAIEVSVHRLAAAVVDARGIDEHDLTVLLRADTEDAVSGGLRFVRGYRDFLPEQAVEQRRFSNVRAADKYRIATASAHVIDSSSVSSCSSIACAAACSALRRLAPSPCVSPTSPIAQVTRKVCSCWSPLTSTTS